MFCNNCGKELPDGAMFCNNCGQRLKPAAPQPAPEPVFVPEPEPEPVFVPEPEPEPEPVFTPEPEPVYAPEPEPEPEPVYAQPVYAPEPEPEPEPAPVYAQPMFTPEPAPEPAPVFEEPRPVREKQKKRPVRQETYAEEPVDQPAFLPEQEPEIPEENRPLSPWAYFGYGLLFMIPVIGWALLILFSFSKRNVNLRNFARSFWCGFILILAIILIVLVLILTNVLKGPLQEGINWLRTTGLDWVSQNLAQ